MKRALLLAAIAATAPAWAGWTHFDSADADSAADEGGIEFFFDPETVRSSGQMRRVWTLHEYGRPNKYGTRSARLLMEVDCAEERIRRLQLNTFKGSMGSGEADINSNTLGEWSYAGPDTVGAGLVKAVCPPR